MRRLWALIAWLPAESAWRAAEAAEEAKPQTTSDPNAIRNFLGGKT